MNPRPSPPRLARLLAVLWLRGEAREVVVGDLDQEFAEAIDSGVEPAAARRLYWRQTIASIAAMRRGDAVREPLTAGRPHPLRGLSLDLTAVLRVFRRSPGYAAIAILSLAIGIGANTTIFSVARQLLMISLPVDHPEDLRLIYWSPRRTGPLGIANIAASSFADASGTIYRSNFTYAQYADMRHTLEGSADLAAYTFLDRVTASAGERPPVAVAGMMASGNFFTTVRPPMAVGRGLAPSDDTAAAPVAAVISHALWTRLFDNDPQAVGKTMRLNGVVVEIVGVTAAEYRGLSMNGFISTTDITIALAKQPVISPEWTGKRSSLFAAPNAYWIRVIGRTTGGTDATIRESLQVPLPNWLINGGIKPETAAKATIGVFPGARGLDSLRRDVLQPLRILAIAAGVVLLIACLNVAGLMLARGVSRQRELAVRRALGAGRARIIRELLLESVLLSVAGGLAGLVLALWLRPALQSMLAAGLGTDGMTVSLDWTLLGATAAMACAAGILAGLVPALRFSRQADAALKDRSGSAGAPRLLIGRAIVALQIAVSLPLVAGAGLFLRTLHNLGSVELGFNPRNLVVFTIDPTMNGQADERRSSAYPRLLERLEAIPGVESATLMRDPLVSGESTSLGVTIGGGKAELNANMVGPRYLETMGIPLVAGRAILDSDSTSAPNVVVINETAARRLFPGRSPIGDRIEMKFLERDLEVVGVAADSKYDSLRNVVEPTMLLSYAQMPLGAMAVAVRSRTAPAALRASIETAVREVDPSLPMTKYQTQMEQIEQTVGQERLFTRLLTLFGGFALLLACVGLHGVTSYSVARRTPEIGIRLALGAQRSRVLWLLLRQVIVLAATGVAIGVPVAWLISPVTADFLFGLGPRDSLTIVAAATLMVAVAVIAGLRPARRAARMEALAALRSE